MQPGSRLHALRDWTMLVLIYIVPVTLLRVGIIHREWRTRALFLVCGIALLVARQQGISLEKLGWCAKRWQRGLLEYSLITILGVLGIVAAGALTGKQPTADEALYYNLVCWVVPKSVAQEFLFRGFLMAKLSEMLHRPVAIIFLNAILFSFLHIIFENLIIVLPLTFLGGLLFATAYQRHPNLILVSAAHIVLNAVAIWYRFF